MWEGFQAGAETFSRTARLKHFSFLPRRRDPPPLPRTNKELAFNTFIDCISFVHLAARVYLPFIWVKCNARRGDGGGAVSFIMCHALFEFLFNACCSGACACLFVLLLGRKSV